MKTVDQVMMVLQKKGDAQTRKTFARHGAPAGTFGLRSVTSRPSPKDHW